MVIMLPRRNLKLAEDCIDFSVKTQLPAGIRLSKHSAKAKRYSYVRYHGEAGLPVSI